MSKVTISDAIRYVGVDDKDIDLFESQYIVPNGVSYNSYVILDEKIAVMDTVDARKTEEWLSNLETELAGKTPDYLVISHLEPDHSGSIKAITDKYPEMKLVSNVKVFNMLPQFFEMDVEDKKVVVAEGDGCVESIHHHFICNIIYTVFKRPHRTEYVCLKSLKIALVGDDLLSRIVTDRSLRGQVKVAGGG